MKTEPRWRKSKNWAWAKANVALLDIFPIHVREAALATCQFVFQAPESVGDVRKNWGKWVRTRLQTFGHKPAGLTGVVTGVQKNGDWIGMDSTAGANLILKCFGLSVDAIYDAYGSPGFGGKYTLDLCEIVTRLAPDQPTTVAAA